MGEITTLPITTRKSTELPLSTSLAATTHLIGYEGASNVRIPPSQVDAQTLNVIAASAAQIKSAYESNSNTNEFSDSEQTKLADIEGVESVGLGGNAIDKGANFDLNDADLGKHVRTSGNNADAATYHWPDVGGSGAVWWNVETTGTGGSFPIISQIAKQAFNANVAGVFYRSLEGTLWKPWIRLDVTQSKNSLINARFAINQEAVSGTVVLAAGDFGHDMMFGGASGCTYTFSTTNNTTVFTISAGSIKQVVASEDVQVGLNVLSHAGTSQGRINGGTYGDSGTVKTTLTGGSNVVCEWGVGTLSLIQLEQSSYATDFKYIDFNEDLEKCQKYFCKSYNLDVAVGTITDVGRLVSNATGTAIGNVSFNIHFPVKMRSTPVISLNSPSTGNGTAMHGGGGDIQATITGTSNSTANVTNSQANASNAILYRIHYKANARITA